jgi:hypothetical protein
MKLLPRSVSFVAVLFAAALNQGCAIRPIHDSALLKAVDGNVVRMTVGWKEPDGHALLPAAYNVEAKYFHWTPQANQYRWVLADAEIRGEARGKIYRRILVPDQIPKLRIGDVIDVYLGTYDETNYGELRAPVVVRLVCAEIDEVCKKREEKKLGARNGIVSRGKPPLDDLTFAKVFDLDGKAIK